MEEFEVIRKFINESDFSDEIKKALLECIVFETQGKPISEYANLVKKLAGN